MADINLYDHRPPITAKEEEDRFYRRMFAFIIALCFALLFVILLVKVPDANKEMRGAILGFVVGTGLTGLITWKWGTSDSSGKKTEAANALATQAQAGNDSVVEDLHRQIDAVQV